MDFTVSVLRLLLFPLLLLWWIYSHLQWSVGSPLLLLLLLLLDPRHNGRKRRREGSRPKRGGRSRKTTFFFFPLQSFPLPSSLLYGTLSYSVNAMYRINKAKKSRKRPRRNCWRFHQNFIHLVRFSNFQDFLFGFFRSLYEGEDKLGEFIGETRTVFKGEMDKQVWSKILSFG